MKKVFLTGFVVIVLLGFFVAASREIFNGTGFNESEEEGEVVLEEFNFSEEVFNESEMVEVEINFTDLNETSLDSFGHQTGQGLANDSLDLDLVNESLVNESEDFYWNREIVNVYFGSGEKMNIKLKVPYSLKNVSEKMDQIKNGNVGQGFSVMANSEESLEDLENELEVKMNGKYSEARLENIGLIRSIEFRDLEMRDNISLGVEELSEERFVQSYAIDPSGMEFREAIVTLVAKGNNLYKCKDWNFSERMCYGDWVLFKEGLVVGEEYSFVLTRDDPGFGEEINITDAVHLDENRNFISNIFAVVQFLDDVWSEFIFSGEYVRATFEQNLTNGNVINLFVRNVLGGNNFLEIYEKDGSVILGTTDVINETKQYDVSLSGMEGYNDVFDIRVVGENGSYLEFDWIYDAAPLSSFAGNFFEGFESGSLVTNNWTTSGAGAAFTVGNSEAIPRTGSYDIWTENTDGESIIGTSLNTTGYQNIIFSFYYSAAGHDSGEYIAADYYNGTAWVNIFQQFFGGAMVSWTLVNNTLGSAANNNANFAIRFRCFTDSNNEDCEVDDIRVRGAVLDTTAPVVDIVYPLNGSSYAMNVSQLNYTYVEINPHFCWYSKNYGATNFSPVSMGVNFTGVLSVEGVNNWTVYCNDSNGLVGSDVVVFSKDTIPPEIDFVSPTTSAGTYNQNYILANVTAVNGGGLGTVVVYLYNSTGFVLSNSSTTSPFFWNITGLNSGIYYLNATANDSVGNINFTETRTISLDSSAPKWSNLSMNVTPVHQGDVVLFNATWTNAALTGYIFSTNNSGSWVNSVYTPFSGMVNFSTNVSIIVANAGEAVGWYFWANDSGGNANSTGIQTFVVEMADSCTYSGSGNWNVNCSDNCLIGSNVDLQGNNISINGVGSFSTTANITNFNKINLAGIDSVNRCEVYCLSGGCFR